MEEVSGREEIEDVRSSEGEIECGVGGGVDCSAEGEVECGGGDVREEGGSGFAKET